MNERWTKTHDYLEIFEDKGEKVQDFGEKAMSYLDDDLVRLLECCIPNCTAPAEPLDVSSLHLRKGPHK